MSSEGDIGAQGMRDVSAPDNVATGMIMVVGQNYEVLQQAALSGLRARK